MANASTDEDDEGEEDTSDEEGSDSDSDSDRYVGLVSRTWVRFLNKYRIYTCIQAEFLTSYSKLKSRGLAYMQIIEVWSHKAGCYSRCYYNCRQI